MIKQNQSVDLLPDLNITVTSAHYYPMDIFNYFHLSSTTSTGDD